MSLPRSCHIQFADGIVNMEDLLKSARDVPRKQRRIHGLKKLQRNCLIEELTQFLVEMGETCYQVRDYDKRARAWSYRVLEHLQAIAFAQTWNCFLGRRTSQMEDLHQILAGMQDINVASIRSLPSQDRMKAILKCHATLPLDLLFCPCGDIRSVEQVNAWAPMFPRSQRLDVSLGT